MSEQEIEGTNPATQPEETAADRVKRMSAAKGYVADPAGMKAVLDGVNEKLARDREARGDDTWAGDVSSSPRGRIR